MNSIATTAKQHLHVPQLTLSEAEEKLQDSTLGYHVELRTPFEHPTHIVAEDVLVVPEFCLERGKGNPNRETLARKVSEVAVSQLSKHFSCTSEDQAKLLLKVYLCDVSDGDREARIFATETGLGMVRLCLAWVLCFPDGSIVLDGGRLGELDNHWYGIWDLLYIKSGQSTLNNVMCPKLCTKIQKRIAIPSGKPWYQFWS